MNTHNMGALISFSTFPVVLFFALEKNAPLESYTTMISALATLVGLGVQVF